MFGAVDTDLRTPENTHPPYSVVQQQGQKKISLVYNWLQRVRIIRDWLGPVAHHGRLDVEAAP